MPAEMDINLPGGALDQLMPLHLVISGTGHVHHAGGTWAKLLPDGGPVGMRLLELFELRRPRNVSSIDALRAAAGSKLRLTLRARPEITMKGAVVDLGSGGQLLLDLSFGFSIVDAVSVFGLNSTDFAATDLAIEMLYLVEAKTAVMNESYQLNARLQGARVAAEEQAFTDTLTGLKNRRALDHILARHTGGKRRFALMQLDLDFFKQVNDTHGHAAGDHVLQQAAGILIEETRPQDTVARVGGDEFVLIFDSLTEPKDLVTIGERIISRLETPMKFQGQNCRISASIGLTLSTLEPVADPAKILANADAALYRSKQNGRAQVSLHSSKADT